jgi:predicted dehydrogenase
MERIRWGVLGVSKFAMTRAIPGMLKAQFTEVAAIASRDLARAESAAHELNLPHAYGSYGELLADPSIAVIYNPLPNPLHVPWSIRALEAGKHVLCEKPIGMNAAEVDLLIAARDKAQKLAGEAFMVRTHPQWIRAKEIVDSGLIGELRAANCYFSYHNVDPANIRNQAEMGGGALMDIGCYPIFTTRYVFGAEPRRVCATMDLDPAFGTDRLTSAILEYPQGHAIFTVSTQVAPAQRMHLFGTKGRLEIEIPFNAPPDRPTRIFVNGEPEQFPVCDQYAVQADAFSLAVAGKAQVPVPLESGRQNMSVIDAIVAAAKSGQWVDVIMPAAS